MAAPWKALPLCAVLQSVMIYLLLIAFIQTCDSTPGLRRRRQAGPMESLFYTSVCESKTMDLRCPPGYIILIEEANFGRSDNVTCTSGPVLTSECFSTDAKEIVAKSCDEEMSCSIRTTAEIFGDECPPGTQKYLEVLFGCAPVPTTIAPPTTPSPETTTSAKTTRQPRERTKQPEKTQLPEEATTVLPDGATTTLPPTTRATTTRATTRPPTTTTTPSTTVVPTTKKPEFCMPVMERGVQWEHAPAGTIDVQNCPPSHVGQAYWRCAGSPAHWTPASGPDLSECISLKIKNITEQLENGASVTVVSKDLAQTIDEEEELVGGDIIAATAILTTSLENLDRELENATAAERTEKTKEVTMNYLKVGSTILEDTNLHSWNDLSKEEQTETASTLITSLEESAFLLANTLDEDETFIDEEENVVMEVVVRSQDDDSDLIFPDQTGLSGNWKGITDSITLPADAIKERNKDGKSNKIVLLVYNNIGQILGTEDMNLTSTPKSTIKPAKQVARHPCSPKQEESENLGPMVNSRVLSVSINDPWESTPLVKPVNLTFEHAVTGDNASDPVCSFWKFDNRSGQFHTGEWSDRGCMMVHNNDTHTVCSCDHLTNFAVIMNIKGDPIPKGHAFALSFITYFGFIISIPCLILALITFCIFKNLQSDRTTIHKNLCLTLIMAEIIFVAGISQTANKTFCAVIAMFLHYFFLSAFAWMCLEGIQLYIMLVEVFEAESSRRKYYYPFGYILPLVIVAISACVDFESYGTPDHCWMCMESYLHYAFIGPVCLIIIGNILFLSMALFIMCQHSSLQTNPKEKTPKEKATKKYRRLSASIKQLRRSSSIFSKHGRKRSKEVDPLDYSMDNSDKLALGSTKTEAFKSLVRGALVLLCLLGVTWAFGLLYLNDDLIVFAYIFTITNAFQGLFIFIFHCCMNDKVKKEYRRYVRNSTWIPDCIREQYGGTILTNSNQQNSYRSSSAVQKRPDSKRYSNTTGSYSVDNRKMSNSSVYRNSGQYEHVKFNSEMSVPEEEHVDFGVARVIADEGISMDFEDNPVHESTRVDAAEGSETQDNTVNNRLSVNTAEFQPLILDLDIDDEKHAKLINVGAEVEQEPSPKEMHPLIRESGIGGSRSGSSCSEDFAPASPLSQDTPNKAHVFPNCGTCGMTGSMPDLINPLTAHARKARMDLVPVAYTNTNNIADVATSGKVHNGYHTLPHTAPTTKSQDSPPYKRYATDSESNPSPWHKRASRMDDIDSSDNSEKESVSLTSPTLPKSPRSTMSALETVI